MLYIAACLNKHGVSLHKYRRPSIRFPTHDDGTERVIIRGTPSTVLAGVANHSALVAVHMSFPRQHASSPFEFRSSTPGDVILE